MSDADDAEFDSADAGAADCIPKQAGEIRKGSARGYGLSENPYVALS